jgi:uncharacterized protein (DUF433 family)
MRGLPKEFTPSEAAAISGLSLRSVQREIDEGPVTKARSESNGRRRLDIAALLYLVILRDVEKVFSKDGKKLIYKAVRSDGSHESADAGQTPSLMKLFDLQKARAELRRQLSKLTAAKHMVVTDPEIRGGEPVIKGTRIGVYEVATMLERGATAAEILEGYPTLRPRHLELAVVYAKAYPRRGRPPRHPWHRNPVALPN